MKKILLAVLTFAFVSFSYSQNKDQLTILNKFITANNAGTEEAFSKFIKETYKPDLYKKTDLKAHIEFYTMISKDFGQLKSEVYKKIEEKPLRIVVYLIKKEESLLNENIDPTEVLIVELDYSQNSPKFLNRALGLGALACELKKDK